MAFKLKQHDTLPNLYFQIFEPDGTTPLDLTNATMVYIAVRNSATGALLFKNPCSVVSPLTGSGYYDFLAADTQRAGAFQYEFEINWSNGDIQTVPVDGYFDLLIIADIA